VLFGGGRNLDFVGENTDTMELNSVIQESLEEILKSKIVPYCTPEIDLSWSGIMGVGKQKKAIVQKHSDNIFIAVRMGGMGIAIGSQIGEDVAKLCLEN
jgi:gamma-glutamylputrescine oxidase